MRLLPELQTPIPPRLIKPDANSPDQTYCCDVIQSNLIAMHMHLKSLISAIALFQYAGKLRTEDHLSGDWQFVAARDGAMSMRNFAHAIANVRGAIGKIPSWLNLVDVKKLKQAHLQFETYFPFAHKLRHSVAHPELYDLPNKEMGVEGGVNVGGMQIGLGGNVSINQGLFNNFYACTFEGELIEYELSNETCQKMLEICRNSFDSFDSVSENQH